MKLQPVKNLPNFFIPKRKLLEFLEKSSDFDLNIVIIPSMEYGNIMSIRTLDDKTSKITQVEIPEEIQ